MHDDDCAFDDTIEEEDEYEDSGIESPERPDTANDPSAEHLKSSPKLTEPPVDPAREAASKALRRTEMMAFVACFLGPVLGAHVLHLIRSQLTHESQDRIVTDMNLTICVLLAEMRPIAQLIEMNKEHTLHLQRIVNETPGGSTNFGNAQGLAQRLAALEARLDEPSRTSTVDVNKIAVQVRQSMQRQVDDLYSAVRRYEKKLLAQSLQIEARFEELDMRMKDTLSLAAAAARTGQKPGIISVALTFIANAFAFTLQVALDVTFYPFRLANTFLAMVSSSMSKDPRASRKRSKGQTNGYTTSRMQSKSGR